MGNSWIILILSFPRFEPDDSYSKDANSVVTNYGSCDELGFDMANGIQNDRLDLTIEELC